MAQEFIDELNRRKAEQAKLGGFNAQPTAAPGLQPQTPMVQPESVFNAPAGGVAAPDAMTMQTPQDQLSVSPVGQPAPTVQAPQGVLSPEERTRVEGRLAQTNADIVASGGTVPSLGAVPEVPSEVIPRGGVRTLGTGGEQSPVAAARTGGIAESENQFGALETLRNVINPSAEQISANLAANSRVGGVQALPPAAVAAPVVKMATQESVANLSVNGTDVVTPAAITEAGQVAPAAVAPQAQLPSTIQNANGQDLMGFKPKYEGQSLTDYMAGRDDPSAASVQVQDPQGRFRRQAAPVAGETPEQNQARTDALFPEQADFQQASADREARQAARPDFGTAVSDRDRRAARGDGMSDADRRDIAKANQRGASAGDVARGDKVAAANGIDRKTGESLEGGGLTFDQQLKLRSQKFNEGKFEYETTKDAKELYDANLTEAKEAVTAEAKAESVGKGLARSVADMRDVMGRASGRLDGFFSTDMVGKAASFWKGSDADAQESDFAFLKSNVALNAMMELKANSPTGSTGFGALNTEELKVLTNQFATLDPFTDSKLVRQNLKQLNERFEGIIQNAYNTHAAEYGKEAADGVYGSMMGGKQAQGQSNQAPSGKSVTTASGRYTATAVTD
jgi:hypothetical protein